jgi:SAM-dependent methyltransferase
MDSSNKIFAQDDKFWDNYSRGRPRVPNSFFDRVFNYHQAKGGTFSTVHDVGAGNGPYARVLRSRFAHVIVSDIVAENVQLARERLRGADGFSFRVSKLEEADDIPPGSVDMVFATNVMHFAEPQAAAMATLARQLRPGGTFVAAAFGPARFCDTKLQDLWARISHQGGRQLLASAENPDQTIRVMARTQGTYNVAPLSRELFAPRARRININMAQGGIQGMLPPEEAHRDTEASHVGSDDVKTWEEEMEGWSFEAGLAEVKEHFGSFPFVSRFPDALSELYKELDELLANGKRVKGYFPVKLILATRI